MHNKMRAKITIPKTWILTFSYISIIHEKKKNYFKFDIYLDEVFG